MTSVPAEIFKAYDIRGVVGRTLTPAIVAAIGRALGSEARARAQTAVAIGRDGRLSGPELSAALARGLAAAGVDVIDIGMAATPMGYFAAHHLGCGSAVMVTGSHNPPDY
ncbi:MAG: phosphomannomutase/phosphoglucomutase, partial [Burkholderiales bacterium]|nr:phosphomannomutase/phosphoglucomutase [Burkholderiales bacterium]